MNPERKYSIKEINEIFKKNNLDFSFENLIYKSDDNINWWLKLPKKIKILLLMNLYKNKGEYNNINENTIISNITIINEYNKIELIKFLKELFDIESFYCSHNTFVPASLTNLNFLEKFTNLKRIHCQDQKINNIDVIKNLEKLEIIDLSNNNISEIPKTSVSNKIIALMLEKNPIKDTANLKYYKNLKTLNLSNNPDLSNLDKNGFSKLKKLENLYIFRTLINDLSPISSLYNLKNIQCYSTEISNIEVLIKLKKLEKINISRTKVSNITALLENNKKLTAINAYNLNLPLNNIILANNLGIDLAINDQFIY